MIKRYWIFLCLMLVLVLLAGCASTVSQGTVTNISHTRELIPNHKDYVVIIVTFDNGLQVKRVVTDYYNNVYKTGKELEVGKEYLVRYAIKGYKIPNYLLDFWEVK